MVFMYYLNLERTRKIKSDVNVTLTFSSFFSPNVADPRRIQPAIANHTLYVRPQYLAGEN